MAMYNMVNEGPKRGESWANTQLPHLLGMRRAFQNVSALISPTLLDERPIIMQLFRNARGSALLPGQIIIPTTTYAGKRATVAAASAGQLIHGVVDWLYPAAGVPDGEHFWAIVNGPCKFINDANATLSEFAALMVSPSVAGSVRAATGDTMAAINSQVGIAEASILASATGYGYFKAPFVS